jgi:hypothetical protein
MPKDGGFSYDWLDDGYGSRFGAEPPKPKMSLNKL